MKKVVNILLVMVLLISCAQKYPFELGDGYKIDYNGNSHFYLLDTNNTVIVNSHITVFNFDSTFIIAEQKPVTLILQNTDNNTEMNLKKRDKLFENSTLKQYWIIDKTKPCTNIGFDSINQFAKYSNVYGPYAKDEFILMRNTLGVSEELKLE